MDSGKFSFFHLFVLLQFSRSALHVTSIEIMYGAKSCKFPPLQRWGHSVSSKCITVLKRHRRRRFGCRWQLRIVLASTVTVSHWILNFRRVKTVGQVTAGQREWPSCLIARTGENRNKESNFAVGISQISMEAVFHHAKYIFYIPRNRLFCCDFGSNERSCFCYIPLIAN